MNPRFAMADWPLMRPAHTDPSDPAAAALSAAPDVAPAAAPAAASAGHTRDDRAEGGDIDADADAELMAAFAAGDASAFNRLYARHEQALYRFVRRLLGPSLAAQADEVFQDTWLRVVQSRERYVERDVARDVERAAAPASDQPTARFRTWLFTLAHHRAIDLLRRSGREVALPEDGDDAPFSPAGAAWSGWPAPGGTAHDDALFWRRAGARLLGCLDELPAAQRAVFLLHHDDEHTLDDIARAMGLGFETAKSRLRYAMSKLRLCMGAYLAPDAVGTRT